MNLKNMTKSAEGTVKDPGRNLKQKSGLNRSLARVAPYGMRMAIQWALFKADGRLILVDPKYTSQTRSQVRIHEFNKSTCAGAFRLPTLRLH